MVTLDDTAPAPDVSTASSPTAGLVGASVCVVGINYAPESTGIAPYTTALARALLAGGAQVRVVTGVPHYPQWRVTDERYLEGRRWREDVDGVPVVRVRHHVPPRADLVGRARMEASFLRGALSVVRRTPADAIVAVTPSLAGLGAGLLGRRGAPLAVVVQDITGAGAAESGTTGRLAGALIGAGELAALRRADLVGVIAPRFGERLVEQGVEAGRVVDLPNFTHIEPSSLTRHEARAVLGWDDGEVLALHTGNMGMKQGLETVAAAARLTAPGTRYCLLGDGNQRTALEAQAEGVAALTMHPPVDDATYPVALAAADVLVLSERQGVREMSLPSKLTSYVAAGRPVVAAVEPGGITHTLLLEHGAAELVPAGDAAALDEAVRRVAADGARSAELVAAGRRMGERLWSAQAAQDRYRDFVLRLLGS